MNQISKSDRCRFLRDLAFKSVVGMSEGVAADGGNAISTDIAQTVADKLWSDTTGILGKVQRFEIRQGANAITLPQFAEPLMAAPATGTRAFWQTEAQTINAVGGAVPAMSKMALGTQTVTLSNIVVMIPVTNELVEDVVNLDDLFADRAAKAAKRLIESEIMFGTGALAGVGYGGSDSTATMAVAIANTPTNANLIAAFKLLHPAMHAGAAWYADHVTYTDLFASGYSSVDKTLGNPTILGLPLLVSPYMDAHGSAKTNLMLGNFSAYGLAHKPAPSIVKGLAVTAGFTTNQMYYRMVLRVAGSAIVHKITCTDGTTRGAFVVPS